MVRRLTDDDWERFDRRVREKTEQWERQGLIPKQTGAGPHRLEELLAEEEARFGPFEDRVDALADWFGRVEGEEHAIEGHAVRVDGRVVRVEAHVTPIKQGAATGEPSVLVLWKRAPREED